MSGRHSRREVVSGRLDVIVGAELDRVVTARRGDHNPEAVADRRVGAVSSDERVIAAVAADGTAGGDEGAEHAVEPGAADDQIVAAITGQVGANERAHVADEPVVTGTPVETVVAELRAQQVVSAEATDAVVAVTGADEVVAL